MTSAPNSSSDSAASRDHRIAGRVRLWLRAEKAFGISSLPGGAMLRGAMLVREETTVTTRNSVPLASEHSARQTVKAVFQPAAATEARSGASVALPVAVETTPTDIPFADLPALTTEQKIAALAEMDANEVRDCTRCHLGQSRTRTAFGEGDVDAKIFFIGEGPGWQEDQQGRPFVGKAGQLLDRMIAGMGLQRNQVYIANVVKCRATTPSSAGEFAKDRAPTPAEAATCGPYLVRQLEIVRPQIIVTLGRPATNFILRNTAAMRDVRGVWHSWRGVKVMPTYHPSYVLREYTEDVRAAVWSDLKKVLAELGLSTPAGVRRGGGEM